MNSIVDNDLPYLTPSKYTSFESTSEPLVLAGKVSGLATPAIVGTASTYAKSKILALPVQPSLSFDTSLPRLGWRHSQGRNGHNELEDKISGEMLAESSQRKGKPLWPWSGS